MLRTGLYVMALLAALWAAGFPPHCPAAIGPDLVVEATWSGSSEGIDRAHLRRLLAWRKGELRGVYSIGLEIHRVIQGKLDDENFPTRPVGTRSFNVLLLNEAAIGFHVHRSGPQRELRGTWRLMRLPDRTYVALSVEDGPFDRQAIARELDRGRAQMADLASGDTPRQLQAIRQIQPLSLRWYALAPSLIELIQNRTPVTISDKMQAAEGKPRVHQSTLGDQAVGALEWLAGPLADRHSPRAGDRPLAWMGWWKRVLETEPLPAIKPEGGDAKELTTLPMDQTSLQLSISPDGQQAILGLTRLQKSTDGASSAIGLWDLKVQADPILLYRVPVTEMNLEPTGIRVAWDTGRLGMVFWERHSDPKQRTVRFQAADRQGRAAHPLRDLELRAAEQLTVGPTNDGWLVAFSDRNGRLFVLPLDRAGQKKQDPAEIVIADKAIAGNRSDIRALSVTNTPIGPVVTVGDENGVFLASLDAQCKFRRVVAVTDPNQKGFQFFPQACWNGQALCVLWRQGDNHGNRLYARTYEATLEPRTDATEIADDIKDMAAPAPAATGFVFAWVDQSQTPNQLRLTTFSNNGLVGDTRILHDAPHSILPISLGQCADRVTVGFWDRSVYPYRTMLKDVTLRP